MASKEVCLLAVSLAAILTTVNGEGHAFSSQHVSRHDGPAHVVYIPKHGHSHSNDHGHEHSHGHIDYYAHPKYDFKYTIHDPHTGDYKSHHEDRDGDVVKGYYELKEPDGTLRHVVYHADKHTGFHATVKHSIEHIVPKHHLH